MSDPMESPPSAHGRPSPETEDATTGEVGQGGKNILIFSDGTGQAGGVRPDQRLSNVYKLFRATRIGPNSPIDPARQLAFYDPGLGTEADAGSVPLRLIQLVRKVASSATGRGITRNVIDCYTYILKHFEPGDRIYLFGFSRGAYTVRCVAGVLNLCGVPTRMNDQPGYPRDGRAVRRIAREAVRTVYEHGAGRDRAVFEQQREELGRRFRTKYGSAAGDKSNVAPHFIGVFDTVAALGATGWLRFAMVLALGVIVALPAFVVGFILSLVTGASTFLLAGGFVACAAAVAWLLDLKSRFKFITNYPDPFWRRWHIAGWKLGFYDKFLDPRVRFARHALAIDETRAAFARVPWGVRGQSGPLVPGEPDRLIQWWFAGDHSDIGGSYAEEESRLSDVALEWMIEEATRIPCPINIDRSRLRTYPSAAGMQHSEVTSLLDRYPNWVRGWLPGWTVKLRTEARGAPWHPSVLQRFQLESVQQSALRAPYRPESLRLDERVADLYR